MRSYNRPIFWAAALSGVVFVLGYLGYRDPSGPALGRDDAVFRALQLFVLDGDFNSTPISWKLNLARFLAAALIVSATLLVLMAFLRDQVNRAWIALRYRQHVVVIGISATNALIAESLRMSGRKVVAIESSAANPLLPSLRAEGVRIVVGDARQELTLRRAQIIHARDILVNTGDDTRNLEVAALAIQAGPRPHPSTMHVAIDQLALWLELGRLALAPRSDQLLVEYYNGADRIASHLVDQATEVANEAAVARSYLDCDGDLAHRLLIHLARHGVLNERAHSIELSTSTAAELAGLLAREPWLSTNRHTATSNEPETAPEVSFVYRRKSDAEAISRGLQLAHSNPNLTLFIGLSGQISQDILKSAGTDDRVQLVSISSETVAHQFAERSSIEVMARARHDHYVHEERQKGVTAEQNPSMVSWNALPEALREQNRHFARSVATTLGRLDAEVRPMRGAWEGQRIAVGPQLLEQLAIDEHDRWVASLTAEGWRYAAGKKDPHAKTHSLLVPWGDLDESERQKDRDAIHAIPRMLARLGYELRLPGDAGTALGSRLDGGR